MQELILKKINIKNFLNLLFCIISIFIVILNLSNLEYSKFLYLVFSLTYLICGLFIINLNLFFFEFFLLSFIWLGFWFKLSLSNIFDIPLCKGYKICNDIQSYNDTIFLSILLMLLILILILVRKKFIKNVKKNFEFDLKSILQNKFVFFIIFSSLLFFSYLGLYNFNNTVYVRGIISNAESSSFIKYSVQWLILYGVYVIISFLLNIKFNEKIKLLIWICVSYLIFIMHVSILSRSMLLISVVLLISAFSLNSSDKDFVFKKTNIVIILFFLFLSFFSAKVSNSLRNIQFNSIEKNYKINKFNKKINKQSFTYLDDNKPKIYAGYQDLFITRWIGISELLIVSNNNDLGSKKFVKALKEKKSDIQNNNYFEKNFLKIKNEYSYEQIKDEKLILKGNTLPGLVAFLYYTGSKVFTLFIISIIYCIFILVEFFCRYISNNNKYFISLIAFFSAYRLVSFGHAPFDTYQFLLSIILSLAGIYILNYFYNYILIKK